jgi:hypothetical protein
MKMSGTKRTGEWPGVWVASHRPAAGDTYLVPPPFVLYDQGRPIVFLVLFLDLDFFLLQKILALMLC